VKVALVTGAGRGIGAAVAEALAARGIVAVLAVRNPATAHGTAHAIEKAGGRALTVRCDVDEPHDAVTAVARVLDELGRLDIVVNNAGLIEPIGRIADTDPQAWAHTITTNLVGAYNMIHAALPAMLKGGGTVVNLSSGAAHTPREGWSAYCASKAGLAMLTRSLQHEYGEQDIAAYGVQPGLVDTPMQDTIRASGVNEISRVPKAELSPPSLSARVIAWLADTRPADLRGQDLKTMDPAIAGRVA